MNRKMVAVFGMVLGYCWFAGMADQPSKGDFTIPLSGTDWRIHEDADGQGTAKRYFEADSSSAGWVPATVPGNVQADLEAAHQLEPLWYGAGDSRLYDVAKKDWWYRKNFQVPASFSGKRLPLVFEGVDFKCEVWINGKQVGANAGMFRQFFLDVTDAVRPGQSNQLAVRIVRMPKELEALLVSADGPMSSGFVGGIRNTRLILKDLKSPTNWGWDWGVNVWTLGIWKDVRLEATGPARIDWIRAQTKLENNYAKATVTASLEINSAADISAKTKFQITGHGQAAEATVDVPLKKGLNTVKADLVLDRPALWWPNGHGEQPLYMLRAEVLPAQGGEAMAVSQARFGVRDVQWVHTEGAPADHISSYQLVINGQPVRTIGSCLIPPDLLFGRMGPRTLNRLWHAKYAGMTMLRVWGGGVILHPEAYDLADELGVMLSVEFPMANNLPETTPEFLGNYETTIRNIIRQVRNHPAIIEYTGGNEMPWKSNSTHPTFLLLKKMVAEDDGRLVRATCPDTGAAHSPWYLDIRRANPIFDRASVMRYGEFGTSSPANLEVLQRELPLKSQWPMDGMDDPVLIRKNIVKAVFGAGFWLNKGCIDGVFGKSDNLPQLVDAGQFFAAEGLRYAVDALRRKGKRFGGLTTWDYNEPWPNGAGSYLVDYDGRTLMCYDFYKQAIAPITLSLKYDSIFYTRGTPAKMELFLTSDAPQPATGLHWKWLARDRRGTVFATGSGEALINPIESKSLGMIELKPPAKTALGPIVMELKLEDAQGKLVAERVHVFGNSSPGSLAGLLKTRGPDPDDDVVVPVAKKAASKVAVVLPVCRTTVTVEALPVRNKGGQEVLEFVIKNTGAMTALFCEPHPLIDYRTDLFMDNKNCFIPPGESRVITVRCLKSEGLSLAETGWRVSCWNADDVTVEPAGDVMLALGRRDQMCREYLGYMDVTKVNDVKPVTVKGSRPDSSTMPYILDSKGLACFEFPASESQAKGPARLRLHTADQSKDVEAVVEVTLNDKTFVQTLPSGIGIQKTDPAHLAFPAAAVFELPVEVLKTGNNELKVRVTNAGWFTWDSMDLISDSGKGNYEQK